MKTFEEAVKKVLTADFETKYGRGSDLIGSEIETCLKKNAISWLTTCYSQVEMNGISGVTLDPQKILVAFIAIGMTATEIGLAIGMEMEKE